MTTPLRVYYLSQESPTIRLAARELARCLRRMTGQSVTVRPARHWNLSAGAIYLGLPASLAAAGIELPAPHRWDDRYVIQSQGESLIFCGANERSILFAAYRWLQELGARWIRPGRSGEHLPAIPRPSLQGWAIDEAADTRHRGLVIEGYCDIDEVCALVEWMPKVRLNAYMLQFRNAGGFWRRWYGGDRYNTWVPGHPIHLTDEQCAAFDDRVIARLQERGLIFHRVGHGWTSGAVGVDESGWGTVEAPSPEIRPLLAQVKGVRDWFGGVPTNTELCYSNPEAFRRIVDEVLAYAAMHPEIDMLHFWGSDNCNNWCECDGCASLQPSDWYITLINAIAPRLAEINPRMQLVIACYSDTMWPPEQVQLVEQHANVTLMFAPYDRCYAHAIADPACRSEQPVPRFRRNEVVWPQANADYARMLQAWQAYLPADADAFSFEYYYWWPLTYDLLSADFARVMHDDVIDYRAHGVNGVLACQTPRAFSPTSLPMCVFADTLWSTETAVQDVADWYYSAAFGPAAGFARDFVRQFAAATGAGVHGNRWWVGVTADRATAVLQVLESVLPQFAVMSETVASSPIWRHSLLLLQVFSRLQWHVWKGLAAHADGRTGDGIAELQRAVAYLWRIFPRVQREMEVPYWVQAVIAWIIPHCEEEERKRREETVALS